MAQMARLRSRVGVNLDKHRKFDVWLLVRSFAGLFNKLGQHSKRRIFSLVFFVIVSSLSESLTLSVLYYFLSVASGTGDTIYSALKVSHLNFLVGDIYFVGAVFLGVIFLNSVIKLLVLRFSNFISYGVAGELSSLFVSHYLGHSYLDQKLTSVEFLQGAITRKTSVVAISFQQMISFISSLFAGVFVIASIFYISGSQLIPVALCVFLIYFFIGFFVKNKIRHNGIKLNSLQDELIKFVQILKYGIRNIILENLKNDVMKSFNQINYDLRTAQSQNSFVQASPKIFIEFIGLLVLVVLTFFNNEIGSTNHLAFLGVMAFSFMKLVGIAQILYFGWTYFLSNGAAIIEFNQSFFKGKSNLGGFDSGNLRSQGFDELVFKNVSFSYPSAATPVLNNISFSLTKGMRLGIVGKTGQGKSTLLDLILGLVNPTGGEITVNGCQLLDNFNRQKFWSMVSHVPQDIFLFGDSVYDNVVGSNDFDQNKFNEILDDLDLGKFIDLALAKSYIGAGGILLSGGERQRMAIAKILYQGGGELLILDEATSALDSLTELKVWNRLVANSGTVIAITHNIELVANFDLLLQVENGILVVSKPNNFSK